MANPNPNLDNLNHYKPKWQSGKTRTIRVPEAIAQIVLQDAKTVDTNGNISLTQVNQSQAQTISELKQQNEYLLDELNKQKSGNISDTSESIDKKQAFKIISKCFSSNKSGQIKEFLAQLGNLLGFQIERGARNKWVIFDTSE